MYIVYVSYEGIFNKLHYTHDIDNIQQVPVSVYKVTLCEQRYLVVDKTEQCNYAKQAIVPSVFIDQMYMYLWSPGSSIILEYL